MPNATDRRRARLYRSGLSLRQVAERERCAASTVLLSLRAAGVTSRPARGPRGAFVPYLALAVRLRAKGWSFARIGARVGRTGEAVRLTLKRARSTPSRLVSGHSTTAVRTRTAKSR